MCPARDDHCTSAPDDQPSHRAVNGSQGVGVLSHYDWSAARPEQARQVGQWVRMVQMDDVGPFPGGGDIAGSDFLGAQRRKRKGTGDERPVAARVRAPATALDCDHLNLMAEV